MKIMQAWVESLTLLKPENFKPFLLVTLKSLFETYKILFTKFWMVVVVSLGLDLEVLDVLTQTYPTTFQAQSATIIFWLLIFIAATVALMALCMVIFLIARPSVRLKDWRYLLAYRHHFIYFSLVWFIAMIAKNLFLLVFIYCILFALFLFDSYGSIQNVGLSFWQALKMFWYNLPLVIITTFLFSLLFFPVELLLNRTIVSEISLWAFFIRLCVVNLIQLPILICFFTNFYVKKKHEQFNLYFPVKGQ